MDYTEKIASFKNQKLFKKLPQNFQEFLEKLAIQHRFTFQDFRQVLEAQRDLSMWGETDLQEWWARQVGLSNLEGKQLKKHLLKNLNCLLDSLKKNPKTYPPEGLSKPEIRQNTKLHSKQSDKMIAGECPVASEETVCCNLKTIDSVENCSFG
ncbi:MAG: hypothetical protein COB67_04955, partial [SAR324 cluster bacterium]